MAYRLSRNYLPPKKLNLILLKIVIKIFAQSSLFDNVDIFNRRKIQNYNGIKYLKENRKNVFNSCPKRQHKLDQQVLTTIEI